MNKFYAYFFSFCISALMVTAQNQATKWYFGNTAGLDFMTNPPTILTNGMLNTGEGCSSIADVNGNVLMYTDGITVYNAAHSVMANGTGLTGNGSTTQSGVIVKQPGSNSIYYIFTQDDVGGPDGLKYNTVDMTLAAGLGSVVAKNITLQTPSCEKLTSVRHCNGVDVWVISHDVGTNVFRNYLVTSTGVSAVPVTSSVGMVNSSGVGTLGSVKSSPNGKKLGVALYSDNAYEVFDFDAATGIVSNAITLLSGSAASAAYSCEFSPDGTKFYGAKYNGPNILQWDMCAGSNTAIIASIQTITTSGTNALASMQLAVNGKIYIARTGASFLDVINTPNVAGTGCGYQAAGQSVAPKTSMLGLPNFITSWFKQPSPPFTYTVTCQNVNFVSPATPNVTISACSANGYSLNSLQWNFGDPGSGSANTSTLVNPTHTFPLGTYTVSLILNYSCGGGIDTLRQVILVNQPCIAVSSTSITCANLGSATVQATGGVGPFSYTWMPSSQTSSVATGLSPGTYTIRVYDFGINNSYTATTVFTSLIPLTGTISTTNSVTCFAAANGTGAITNITGGSGNQNYLWTNGLVNYTTASTQSLSAGVWTVSVVDALTGCFIKQSFLVTQPNSTTVNIVASSPTACANSVVTLTGSTTGGTAPYQYAWTGGPNTNTRTVTQNSASTVVYTLSSADANSCASSKTISIDYIANPTITVSSVTVCPLRSGTLIAGGATTYTWSDNTNANSLVDSPPTATQYTVYGSTAGCTSSATALISLYPLPVPGFSSNSPICTGRSLSLTATGGSSYSWAGPNAYSASGASPVIGNANPSHSGAYQVTVTSAQGCTATTAGQVTIHPSPTVAATGATVCNTQTVTLNGASDPGNLYQWSGPASYQSTLQNAPVIFPNPTNAGNYALVVTSPQGCTNSAVAVLAVTMVPVPLISSDQPECEGGSIQLNGSGGGSYSWSGPNGFLNNSQNPQLLSVPYAANGVYHLTVTLGPCQASTQYTITVYALPQLTVSTNSPVCETRDLHLSAIGSSGVTHYAWKGPGFSSPNATPVRPNSIVSYAGIYTVTVTDFNQCMSSVHTTVVINKNPVISATGNTVCLFSPATLKATGADSYFWQGPNFFQTSVAEPTVVNVSSLSVGVYTVTGTDLNGCTAVATATMNVLSLPVPTLIVEPKQEFCLNEKAIFRGWGGKIMEWYAPLNIYKQGSVMELELNMPQLAGTYTLKVTDDKGCSASISTTIAVKPLPDGTLLGTENSACAPFCSDFRFQPNENPLKVKSRWTLDGNAFHGGKFSYCFTEAGNFKITGSLYDSVTTCANVVDYQISAYPKPNASFTNSPVEPHENDEVVYFTNTSEGDEQVSWRWLIRHNNTNWLKETENTFHVFNDPGSFPVALLVENIWGCSDTVVSELLVREDFALYVPNAFTPTNDGKNDRFRAVGRGINKFHLTIFDRWGAVIYESYDINEGWDGTVSGKAIKSDVYNWRIQATSIKGENKELLGHVTLYQ